MTLLIHYSSLYAGVSRQFDVVLDYCGFSFGCFGACLKKITEHLPEQAEHYGPINDFSYVHGGHRKLVRDDATYLELEACSRQQNDTVHVHLTQKDALEMAHHWERYTAPLHENVFEILKRNTLVDTMLVHGFAEANLSVYYHLKGQQHRER